MSNTPENYSKLTLPQLRKLCVDKKIPKCIEDKDRKLKRAEIVKLLNEQRNSGKFPISPRKKQSPKKENEFEDISIVFEDEEKGVNYINRELNYHYMNEINFHLAPYEDNGEEFVSTISITFEDLKKEIINPVFIFNFKNSIEFLKFKFRFYQNFYLENQKALNEIDEKIKAIMSKAGFRAAAEYSDMKTAMEEKNTQIENILNKIKLRLKNLSLEGVEKNLLISITDPVKGLDSLVGRRNIKNMIASQLYAFSKNYKIFTSSFNNICLMGSAGTGKTAVAKVLSFIYSNCGILLTDTIDIVTRVELVGQHIGETAPKTRNVLMHTLEGILFIDEAYQLANPISSQDFGHESITEIVNFLDKYIGMNIVIVAGYEDKMKNWFFGSNEGLFRRFPYQIVLRNYSAKELSQILLIFMQQKLGYALDDAVCDYIYTVMEIINKEAPIVFKYQAGDALNLGTSIVRFINSSYRVVWEPNNISNNIIIINEGINEFLKMKGFILQ